MLSAHRPPVVLYVFAAVGVDAGSDNHHIMARHHGHILPFVAVRGVGRRLAWGLNWLGPKFDSMNGALT